MLTSGDIEKIRKGVIAKILKFREADFSDCVTRVSRGVNFISDHSASLLDSRQWWRHFDEEVNFGNNVSSPLCILFGDEEVVLKHFNVSRLEAVEMGFVLRDNERSFMLAVVWNETVKAVRLKAYQPAIA